MRRIKTEFLLQFEGMTTASAERIVVVAATNRPQVEILRSYYLMNVSRLVPQIDPSVKLYNHGEGPYWGLLLVESAY